jgi:hypothetical protein
MVRKISYWGSTVVISAVLAFAAFAYLSGHPDAVKNLGHLGYPQYFRVILGVAKALGAIALLYPGLALVKEWAYAGLTFTWIGAFVSHTVARDGKSFMPVILLALLAASYLTRPATRRIAPAEAPKGRPDGTE